MNLRSFTISGFVSNMPKYCEKAGIPIFGFTVSHQEKNEKGEVRWFNFPVRSFNKTALELKESLAKGSVITAEGELQPSKNGQLYMNVKSYKIHLKAIQTKPSNFSTAEIAEWVSAYENAPEAGETR